MKALTVMAAVAAVAFSGWWLASPDHRDQSDLSNPSKATNITPAEVFRKAFWKHPTANDHILHAERREWTDAHGIQQWRWFIVVEPSPELIKYLRTDNAFNLVPSAVQPSRDNAPAWFAPVADEVETLSAAQSHLCLSFSKAAPLLYATDAGSGFRPAQIESAASYSNSSAAAGRLPLTPPPLLQR
jgi:hypothetical protein